MLKSPTRGASTSEPAPYRPVLTDAARPSTFEVEAVDEHGWLARLIQGGGRRLLCTERRSFQTYSEYVRSDSVRNRLRRH